MCMLVIQCTDKNVFEPTLVSKQNKMKSHWGFVRYKQINSYWRIMIMVGFKVFFHMAWILTFNNHGNGFERKLNII